VSRNKIFHCAYFSMHFRIKFLLFNDFPSYIQSMFFGVCSHIYSLRCRHTFVKIRPIHFYRCKSDMLVVFCKDIESGEK